MEIWTPIRVGQISHKVLQNFYCWISEHSSLSSHCTSPGTKATVAKSDTPVLSERLGEGLFGLSTTATPGENFDLTGWYITTPADDDVDGKSDSVYEKAMNALAVVVSPTYLLPSRPTQALWPSKK